MLDCWIIHHPPLDFHGTGGRGRRLWPCQCAPSSGTATEGLYTAVEAVGDNTKGSARPAAKVWFAVDVEAHVGPTAEPTKQDQRAPIKIVGGRAWSPGIYQALRLLGKSLDVAWEKAFIRPLTFN